jgi:hypothetical protein
MCREELNFHMRSYKYSVNIYKVINIKLFLTYILLFFFSQKKVKNFVNFV